MNWRKALRHTQACETRVGERGDRAKEHIDMKQRDGRRDDLGDEKRKGGEDTHWRHDVSTIKLS